MVAFTSLELPYQQSTDRPCDAPTVWCNFAEQLESLLNAEDDNLARLQPSVPVARGVRTTALPINGATTPFGTPVVFDYVDFDTDNMIDFSRSPSEIKPSRLGWYMVVGTLTGSTNIATASGLATEMEINKNAFGSIFPGISAGGITVDTVPTLLTAGTVMYWRGEFVNTWLATDTIGYSLIPVATSTSIFTVTRASLTVLWLRDP